MSDQFQPQQPGEQPEEQSPQKNKASTIRTIVLVGFLVVLGAALAYDFAVARPAHKKSFDEVGDMVEEGKTMDDVHELIGKDPIETRSNKQDITIEKYSWRSGLLVTTHIFYVTYDRKLLNRIEGVEPVYWPDLSAE